MAVRRLMCVVLCVVLAFSILPLGGACAEETAEATEDITNYALVTKYSGIPWCDQLFDGNTFQANSVYDQAYLTLEHPEGIGSIYLIFDLEYDTFTVTNNGTGETALCGGTKILHQFVDLAEAFGEAPTSVTISFHSGNTRINEISVFTPGEVPDSVQKWDLPKEGETDLILFSAHSDDEQLFFAGLLPYYAGERDYEVLVVTLTDHRRLSAQRCHELLDGLWAVGVTTYPVIGSFWDIYTTSMEDAYEGHRYVQESEEELLGFVVEQLRRYRPLVAVGHDLLGGEYGHGQHMMYADLLCRAVEIAADPTQYPDLAEQYGVWDVPKTYLHLWPKDEIVMDWDQPLERFGGMTAYQVSRDLGFPCHKSQYADFAWYFEGSEDAAGVPAYNPCNYGLYRTTVGQDVEKKDFFENLTPYSEQAREETPQPPEETPTSQMQPEEAEPAETAPVQEEKIFLKILKKVLAFLERLCYYI